MNKKMTKNQYLIVAALVTFTCFCVGATVAKCYHFSHPSVEEQIRADRAALASVEFNREREEHIKQAGAEWHLLNQSQPITQEQFLTLGDDAKLEYAVKWMPQIKDTVNDLKARGWNSTKILEFLNTCANASRQQ